MLNPRFLEPGSKLGRFKIRERLGRGAMATVYLADDTLLGTPVAVKALHADRDASGDDPGERLKREIDLARRVAHPGVCRVFDLHEVQGVLFLSMEYVDGRSLESVLDAEQRLSGERTARIIGSVCLGLQAAHDAGILHRDLKPGNIMLRPNDEPAILDFGYATGPDVGRLTATGVWVGTLQYLAPEQLKSEPATRVSDVYSIGVTLYRCLTGQFPFPGLSYGEIASGVLYHEPTRPSEHVANIGPDLEAVVLKAMSREPAMRYDSAAALARALDDVEGDLREVTHPGHSATDDGDLDEEDSTDTDVMRVQTLDDGTTQREVVRLTVLVCESLGSGSVAVPLVTQGSQPITDSGTFRPELRRWRGTPVATDGNGFAAWFSTADDAVRAGLGMQREATRRSLAADIHGPAPSLRIGIRTGFARLDGRNIGGGAVDAARAVAAAAEAGELLIDGETHAGLGEALTGRATSVAGPARGELVELFAIDTREDAKTSMAYNPLADAVAVEKRRAPVPKRMQTDPQPSLAPAAPVSAPAVSDKPVPDASRVGPTVGKSARAQMAGLALPDHAGVPAVRPSTGPPSAISPAVGKQPTPAGAAAGAPIAEASPPDAGEVEWKAPSDPGELRQEHAELTQRLKIERQERGVIAGDNWTLDSLEKTAELELTRGRWTDAVEYLRLALSELEGVQVDAAFVRAKTQRFQTALRERGGLAQLKKFQPKLTDVVRTAAAGDPVRANAMLNEAFGELRGT